MKGKEFLWAVADDRLESTLESGQGIESAFIGQTGDGKAPAFGKQKSFLHFLNPVFVDKLIKGFVHVLVQDGGEDLGRCAAVLGQHSEVEIGIKPEIVFFHGPFQCMDHLGDGVRQEGGAGCPFWNNCGYVARPDLVADEIALYTQPVDHKDHRQINGIPVQGVEEPAGIAGDLVGKKEDQPDDAEQGENANEFPGPGYTVLPVFGDVPGREPKISDEGDPAGDIRVSVIFVDKRPEMILFSKHTGQEADDIADGEDLREDVDDHGIEMSAFTPADAEGGVQAGPDVKKDEGADGHNDDHRNNGGQHSANSGIVDPGLLGQEDIEAGQGQEKEESGQKAVGKRGRGGEEGW